MYCGSWIPVCLEATLHYVNTCKTFYTGQVVPVHQTNCAGSQNVAVFRTMAGHCVASYFIDSTCLSFLFDVKHN